MSLSTKHSTVDVCWGEDKGTKQLTKETKSGSVHPQDFNYGTVEREVSW